MNASAMLLYSSPLLLLCQGIVGLSSYIYLLRAKGGSDTEIASLQKLIDGFVEYWITKGISSVSNIVMVAQ